MLATAEEGRKKIRQRRARPARPKALPFVCFYVFYLLTAHLRRDPTISGVVKLCVLTSARACCYIPVRVLARARVECKAVACVLLFFKNKPNAMILLRKPPVGRGFKIW